ncbi:C-factor isoform X2 [Manihot esculenta]|uniref:C-factor isoform X2 n=1 Tax=Manihot esculenta TaxID=3983 RepID=UPI001CC66DEF|nr:C-factor isoform X2 [Manihot esculenta]
MKLLLLNYRAFLSTPVALTSVRRAFSAAAAPFSASKWEGGVAMVQGASRGIGLEFATTMSIREKYGSLNLLINASGILSIPNVLQPETTLNKVEKSSLMLAYEVNAVGPILIIRHMWPLLKAGGGSGTQRDVAVVANLSARVGSIGDNRLGGWHSYRSSKAALNQLTKTVSVEFARKKDPIICILLHPGTVDTDLSRPFQRNVPEGKLFTKEFSVQKLLNIINNAKSHDNGKFFAWDGQEIPW